MDILAVRTDGRLETAGYRLKPQHRKKTYFVLKRQSATERIIIIRIVRICNDL